MLATVALVPSQLIYMSFPASSIRTFVDGCFPEFARYPAADFIRGQGHRYKGGHDVLLDVTSTFYEKGWGESLHHFGHVVLTDFPTKAGIPIPGFSQNGLGQHLESLGIHRGWLSVNICDGEVGIIAIAEGATDLQGALQDQLQMGAWTFFDTFGEGLVEISLGFTWQNPFLVAGGIENVLSGIVSTWNLVSVYVDPLDLLGASFVSALLGFSVSTLLLGENPVDGLLQSFKSGVIGGLFCVSGAFGIGAIMAFASYGLAQKLAQSQNDMVRAYFKVDQAALEHLVKEILDGDPAFLDIYRTTCPLVFNSTDAVVAHSDASVLNDSYLRILPSTAEHEIGWNNFLKEVIATLSVGDIGKLDTTQAILNSDEIVARADCNVLRCDVQTLLDNPSF